MRKEGVWQDDFGSHVKVLRKVSAGARSRSRHVRPLGRVFAHFFFFAFREKSVSAPARKRMRFSNKALIPCLLLRVLSIPSQSIPG